VKEGTPPQEEPSTPPILVIPGTDATCQREKAYYSGTGAPTAKDPQGMRYGTTATLWNQQINKIINK